MVIFWIAFPLAYIPGGIISGVRVRGKTLVVMSGHDGIWRDFTIEGIGDGVEPVRIGDSTKLMEILIPGFNGRDRICYAMPWSGFQSRRP
jgi:hypothetical protein